MRVCEIFLTSRGQLLGSHGYQADPGRVELTAKGIAFYHYTRPENLEAVLKAGLRARLPVVSPPSDLAGLYLVEALLESLPKWITESPYFRDLGLEMFRQYVGDILLRIKVPHDFPGLYVADYAHILEAKHVRRRSRPSLNLGYDCSNGKETSRAEANSYIPIMEYRGGHVAPEIKVTRKGKGVAVPPEYISVCEIQPLKN